MPKIIRVTTVPMALKVLLRGQMKFMKEHGFDVIMVSSDGLEREDVINFEGVPHQVIPMTRRITPFKDFYSLWQLYCLFRKEKPDIVHSHTPKAGLIAMLAAKMAGIEIRIHTIAGLRFMTSSGTTRRVLISMEKLTSICATHVWPNSYTLMQYIQKYGLVKAEKLSVVGKGSSNGIDLNRFSPSLIKEDKLKKTRELICHDPNLKYFLCVGRIVKDKGIAELLDAYKELHDERKDCRLILVGPFEDELDPVNEESRNLIDTHPGIIHVGWSNEVEYFMHLAFALVHPSHREGFPNVLLQAGAMNCPVICSRIEGNIDIVEDRKTGLLFEVNNASSLLLQLKYALTFKDDLNGYARNLRLKIERHFDQKVVQELIERKYRDLLKAAK